MVGVMQRERERQRKDTRDALAGNSNTELLCDSLRFDSIVSHSLSFNDHSFIHYLTITCFIYKLLARNNQPNQRAQPEAASLHPCRAGYDMVGSGTVMIV